MKTGGGGEAQEGQKRRSWNNEMNILADVVKKKSRNIEMSEKRDVGEMRCPNQHSDFRMMRWTPQIS